MVYECDKCSAALPAGVRSCPKCGETFEDDVPTDAEVPKRGFRAAPTQVPPLQSLPVQPPPVSSRPYSGYDSGPPPVIPPSPKPAPVPSQAAATGGSSGLRIFGCLLLIGGLSLAGYYFLVFDPSVVVPTSEILGQTFGGGRVNNLGLMAEKQNGIVVGMGGAILGAILMYAGRRK